jgi:hypothetical protein
MYQWFCTSNQGFLYKVSQVKSLRKLQKIDGYLSVTNAFAKKWMIDWCIRIQLLFQITEMNRWLPTDNQGSS